MRSFSRELQLQWRPQWFSRFSCHGRERTDRSRRRWASLPLLSQLFRPLYRSGTKAVPTVQSGVTYQIWMSNGSLTLKTSRAHNPKLLSLSCVYCVYCDCGSRCNSAYMHAREQFWYSSSTVTKLTLISLNRHKCLNSASIRTSNRPK